MGITIAHLLKELSIDSVYFKDSFLHGIDFYI